MSGARQELQARLGGLRALMVASALGALLLFAGYAAYRLDQMHADAQRRLQRSLRLAHEHALRVLDTNETLLRHALSLTQGQDDAALRARRAELHAQLAELARNKPQVHSIWIHGADGRPIAGDRLTQPRESLDISARDDFQWHRAGKGGLAVSELVAGQAEGERLFHLSRARQLRDGGFGGVVSVALRAPYFTELHAELAADEPGMAVTMFRADGVVFSRWPQLPGAPGRMAARSEVLQRVLRGETAGTIRSVSSLDGQPRVILFQKLGDYPVHIGTGRELAAIRGAWLREMGTLAAFALLPALGIVYAGYLAMRRSREALEAARRLQEESEARRQAEEALLQAQKMEALGRLTGGVAHDFNNALMVISGNLHLLRVSQPQAPAKFVDAIGRAVESATKLTRQLLAFSRRQALAPVTVRLQERIPALRDLLAPVLGSQVQLQIEVDPRAAPVHVDPAELELALLNLAVNARDAMPRGGRFGLHASNTGEGALVCIEASDTGEGMAPEVAARAFDPFFTTKPLGAGTGLGLSQVQAFCKRAGGDVSLRSQPGQGTTVRMQLPAAAPAAVLEDAPASDSRDYGKTVLLVEDNADVAAVIVPVLERLGCRVVHVSRADAALDRLAARPGEADLVLTDVVMPGPMDGLALAGEVRARHPSLKLLLMTGYAEQIDAISAQGLPVLPKPFSPGSLIDALDRAFEPAARPAAGAAT